MGNMLQSQFQAYFKYDHLPEKLQEVSKPFCKLAVTIWDKYGEGAEVEQSRVALQKLLEAKDAAVRAQL